MELLEGKKYIINRIYCPDIRLYHVSNLLSDTECEELIKLIDEEKIYKTINESGKQTSYLWNYTGEQKRILENINYKLHQILGIPNSHGEVIQGHIYGPNQKIDPHYDFFNSSRPEDQKAFSKCGQRIWTFIVYLNNVEYGGETHFIYPNIKIQPKAGTGIFWENLSGGKPNYRTLHAGLPLESGKKYILTKWFRENKIRY